MSKVLVTGGAGYIGAVLVDSLAKQDGVDEIVVFDNLARKNYGFFTSSKKIEGAKVNFVMGDLLDSRQLKKVLEGVEVVYHLAAKTTDHFADVDSHVFEQVNNWGTAELMYAIEESSTVKKVVYLSSMGVYGNSSQGLCTEETRLNPRMFYDISKMRGEEHVLRMEEKVETYVVRLGNVYGYSPSMRFESVINRFMFDSHFNGRISIHGSGKQRRSFIHIDKVASVLVEFMGGKIPTGVYNLADHNSSILDLVDLFKELNPEMEYLFINQNIDLRDVVMDTDLKLKQYVEMPEGDLKSELEAFQAEHLAF